MLKSLFDVGARNTFALSSDESGSQPTIIHPSGDDGNIHIPDAHLLFSADFSRESYDLILTGGDRAQTIVPGYFSMSHGPDLVSPSGALLNFETVRALAGPLAPGQYAQASNPTADVAIGKVVTGEATAAHVDGSSSTLQIGDTVYHGDVLQTGVNSGVGVVFTDNTVFSLSANSRLVLDEYVYQDGGNDNSMLFSLVQGTFTFVTGKVAPTGEMKIETPVATMGIRGTTVHTRIAAIDGTTVFRILEDPGTGRVGSYVLLNRSGAELAVVDDTGTQYTLESATSTPVAGPIPIGGDEQETINSIYSTAIRAGLIKAELDGPDTDEPNGHSGNNSKTAAASLLNLDHSSISTIGQGLAIIPLSEEAGTADTEGETITDVVSIELITTQSAHHNLNFLFDDVSQPPSVPEVVLIGNVPEDSGARIITEAELLEGAVFPVGQPLFITSLTVPADQGAISSNGDGTWTFLPALDFHGPATIAVLVSDGTNQFTSTALLDVTAVNDAPVAVPVVLASIGEDSGTRLITSAELLAGASDVDSALLTITALSIASGGGSLIDNLDGTWSYAPGDKHEHEDGLGHEIGLGHGHDYGDSVSFSYTVSDGELTATSTASLDLTVTSESFSQMSLGAVVQSETDSSLDPLAIDAGSSLLLNSGIDPDQLIVTGANLLIDSASFLDISGIEFLDISGSGTNTLTLTGQDVVNIGDGNSTYTLVVDADPDSSLFANDGDRVVLLGDWTPGVQGVNPDGTSGGHYDVYTSTDVLASIAIDHDAHVTVTA